MESHSGSGSSFCDLLLLDHIINWNWTTFFLRWKCRETRGAASVQEMWRCSRFWSLWKESKMGSFSLGTNMVAVRLKERVWWEPCGSRLPKEVALFLGHVHFSVLLSRELRPWEIWELLHFFVPSVPIADSHTRLLPWQTEFGMCEFWCLPSLLITRTLASYLTLCVCLPECKTVLASRCHHKL